MADSRNFGLDSRFRSAVMEDMVQSMAELTGALTAENPAVSECGR